MSIAAQIISAGERDLPDLVDAPDMRDTVVGSCRPMTLQVTKIASGPGGDAETSVTTVQADGFTVAVDPRKLNLKPEGTRKWKSFMMYTLNDPNIEAGDRVAFASRVFKVIKSWDLSQFGFYKFGILEDFS